jgi:hypothetical protein
MQWRVCLTLHSDLRSSQILHIVDVDPLCVKSWKIADLIYTATEDSNRASSHTDDIEGRLRYLWARYQFKCVGLIYANSERDNGDRKIRGLTYKKCFSQNLIYIGILHTSPPPSADERTPSSCIEYDSLKPAMLIIAVNTMPALLFSTQSY